jgi:hypothetical protein
MGSRRQAGPYRGPAFRPDPRHIPRQPQDRFTYRRPPEVDTDTDADPDAERNARETANPNRGPWQYPRPACTESQMPPGQGRIFVSVHAAQGLALGERHPTHTHLSGEMASAIE